MLNVGFFELTLLLAVALVVLGPDKLPEAARTLGRYYVKLRRVQNDIKARLENELKISETQALLQAELDALRSSKNALEARVNAMQMQMMRMEVVAHDALVDLAHTPRTDMWFLVSEVERMRLLPPAPLLPATHALDLLP